MRTSNLKQHLVYFYFAAGCGAQGIPPSEFLNCVIPLTYAVPHLCRLIPGAWGQECAGFEVDWGASTLKLADIDSNDQWARTTRWGSLGMLACCEEILKDRCQPSVLGLLRPFSETCCITVCTDGHCWRWPGCSSVLSALSSDCCLARFCIFCEFIISVNVSFQLVKTCAIL